jgi:ABC-type glycerol-3-phosphate transport system permease component
MTARALVSGAIHRPRKTGLTIAVHVVAIAAALAPILPVVWVMFTALKERNRIVIDPLSPPAVAHWQNFPDAWQVGKFDRYFLNSVFVAVPTVVIVLVVALLAGYAFARMRFRGRDTLFVAFIAGLTIPMSVLVIPLFYQIRDMGLLSTPWALIWPQAAKQLPFAILLLYSFIRELPSEIFDAAVMDGCSRWQALRHIVVPLSTPAMVTLIVFTFMWSWNNFLLPVVLIHEDAARTLPVGLNAFRGRFLTDVPMMMAGATITYLPVIFIYLIFQRHFIRGISAGALK